MRNRARTAAVMVVALLWSGVLAAPWAVAAPDPSEPALTAEPSSTVVPATIEVSGSCPAIGTDYDENWVYPSAARLTFPAADVTLTTVDLDAGGEFSESYPLPATLAPDTYGLTLFCDNSEIGTSVTVEAPYVPATLELDPTSGHAGDAVSARGTCPTDHAAVKVIFGDVAATRATPDSSTGAFAVEIVVPAVDPGVYDVTTSCDGTAPFEVLQPPILPTLGLDPASGEAGDDVSATGTCPLPRDGVTLSFDGVAVSSGGVDPDTGAFALAFAVLDVDGSSARVTTDCGGQATFTMLFPQAPGTPAQPVPGTPARPAPGSPAQPGSPADPGTPERSPETPAPPTRVDTPEGPRVKVPDLTGLTEEEAVAALGDALVLGNPTGRDGRVEGQLPPPGTFVEPASAVAVVLDEPPRSLLWLLVPAALVLAMVGGLVARERKRVRRRRVGEEHWVQEQVRTEAQLQGVALSDVPDHVVPGVDVRVEVRREPARL